MVADSIRDEIFGEMVQRIKETCSAESSNRPFWRRCSYKRLPFYFPPKSKKRDIIYNDNRISNREIGSRREHVSWGGIDMTTEELETILEDLDFMVEIVRQNCGTVSFLSVAHSARNIRQILKSVIQEKDTNEPSGRAAFDFAKEVAESAGKENPNRPTKPCCI